MWAGPPARPPEFLDGFGGRFLKFPAGFYPPAGNPPDLAGKNPQKILVSQKFRTIFSFDFLPKFIERAIQDAFDKVRAPDEYGQFAYQPNRSCELVVAIGLNEVEKSNEPSIGFGLDARKAFDTSRWSTMGHDWRTRHQSIGA